MHIRWCIPAPPIVESAVVSPLSIPLPAPNLNVDPLPIPRPAAHFMHNGRNLASEPPPWYPHNGVVVNTTAIAYRQTSDFSSDLSDMQ